MHEIERMLDELSGIVWGPPMLALLVGTHLFLTFRLRFIQRYLGTAIRISLTRSREGEGDVSQFGALATALAAAGTNRCFRAQPGSPPATSASAAATVGMPGRPPTCVHFKPAAAFAKRSARSSDQSRSIP